jgi:hypothetical protein
MAGEENGNGFRVTTGMLYEAQQATGRRIAELTQQIALMDARMNAVLEENKSLMSRIEKLEGRFSGILVGLGTGIIAGAIALFRVGM